MMDTNYKILDRTTPPAIRSMENFQLARPERLRMKNGMPLHVIRAGSQEVVRLDVLIGGGQWHRPKPCRPCLPIGCYVRGPFL